MTQKAKHVYLTKVKGMNRYKVTKLVNLVSSPKVEEYLDEPDVEKLTKRRDIDKVIIT